MLKYKVFVINLARSQERLAQIAAQLAEVNIPFERIDAVEGKQLSADEIEAVSPARLAKQHYYRDLSKGEIGCSLSHKRAWQKIIDDDLDLAFVFEDDIHLEANFADTINMILNLPTMNWDFIKLYPLTRKSRKNIQSSMQYGEFEFVTYKKFPLGAMAQAISRRGAESLISHMPYIVQPVDGHLKSWWSLGITPFGLLPYCISVDIEGPSDINPDGNLERAPQRRVTKLMLNWSRALMRFIATPQLEKQFRQFTQALKKD
ncbi:glycosyltransferase family 25 protein [Shewanella polaris]|uniref:Glycosyltransferase family 25 protein n=1 Tax=Shewanella polaris TaxID=2588449 RepID=A0A4Y5YKK7_9GAMM|nr:glycosyltransferase family 25 protein [Shewanella polaris]QDE33019.1 glycosyltransferase family 25 protein [Shewanella polaris]